MPRILVFASGSKDGGGSGFRWLIHGMLIGLLKAVIVGVVSNHEHGGVRKIADQYGIPFVHLANRHPSAGEYRDIRDLFQPDLIVFSGWLLFVLGINGVNIHPGLLPETGKKHGGAVHAEAIRLFHLGLIPCTAVTMHMIVEEDNEVADPERYDCGPILFVYGVYIEPGDDAESLGHRVNEVEHGRQTEVTSWIAQGLVGWTKERGVFAPPGYPYLTLPTPLTR